MEDIYIMVNLQWRGNASSPDMRDDVNRNFRLSLPDLEPSDWLEVDMIPLTIQKIKARSPLTSTK